MRTIPAAVQALFDSGEPFLVADLITIRLVDGTLLSVTTFDRDIAATVKQVPEDGDGTRTANFKHFRIDHPKLKFTIGTEVTSTTLNVYPTSVEDVNWNFDNEGYKYRQKITIHHEYVAGALTDFPVAVQIKDAANPIWSRTLANGYDVIFKSADGTEHYKFERSVWDKTNHLAVFYVKVTELSAARDTVLYMHYGYAGETIDQQSRTAVWDSNYKAVYHFEEDPTTANSHNAAIAYDSTANAHTATVLSVDGAGYYLPSGSRVSSPMGRGWQVKENRVMLWNTDVFGGETQAFTVEGILCRNGAYDEELLGGNNHAWLGITSVNFDLTGILDVYYTWNGSSFVESAVTKDAFQFVLYSSSGITVCSPASTSYDLSSFHHIAGTGVRSEISAASHIDGTCLGTSGGINSWGKFSSGAYSMQMGQKYGVGSLDGILSEVRISNIERSHAWIATTAHNLISNSTFLSFGGEEQTYPYPDATSDTINDFSWVEAIRLGVFDGAIVQIESAFLDIDGKLVGGIPMFSGRVGEIDASGIPIQLKVNSLMELLSRDYPKNLYMAQCQYTWGSSGCGLSRAAWAQEAAIGSGDNTVAKVHVPGTGKADGYFDLGKIVLSDGTSRTIRSWAGDYAYVYPVFDYVPVAGDAIRMYPGDDKTKAKCVSKFDNLSHYRGFPFIPKAESAY